MKIVVIGGTGLIGSKVVAKLTEHGHEAVPASPNSGVNTLTGEGVDAALAGADVVVDVSNSPSFEEKAVMDFFTTSTNTLIAAERAAGVKHHVALSVVGTERMTDSGYMRAKVAQEVLIRESGIPFTIVHATQFFEFVKSIADAATDGDTVRLAPVFIAPMAAEDVSTAVARAAAGSPAGGVHEVRGPEEFRLTELIARGLQARGDARTVVADPDARYFGAHLSDRELVPAPDAEVYPTTFEQWLDAQVGALR
ncbi:SDR family oxidoreductase [Leifsonia sp. fls2-241-R2A-40a]|uniref:SDR family oxidoreductase n=1 Tax=Leifsonia sp. fls2-241-R2A-40a TaxID=3040290 RepID=UPI002549C43A|nr:SDR family oxidoreductase [Leifsonia sp. fls2-241-R2A-40a]